MGCMLVVTSRIVLPSRGRWVALPLNWEIGLSRPLVAEFESTASPSTTYPLL